jgi:hypothetical protein
MEVRPMIRLASLGFFAILAAAVAACASEAPSGAAMGPVGNDRFDPVNTFPQARGANSYMRQ